MDPGGVPEPSHTMHRFWLPPARAFPFGPLAVAGATVVQGAGLLVGYAIEETTGAASARAVIGDGAGAAITVNILPVTLVAGESVRDVLPMHGVAFERGLSVVSSAGSVAGSLWVVLLTRRELALVHDTRQGEGF